jgi:hypothetical protein
MKLLSSQATHNITGGALNINGKAVTVNNDFDIPEDHFKIIEDTFQSVIDESTHLYKATQSLKDLHICKYDTTHYFTSLLKALSSN